MKSKFLAWHAEASGIWLFVQPCSHQFPQMYLMLRSPNCRHFSNRKSFYNGNRTWCNQLIIMKPTLHFVNYYWLWVNLYWEFKAHLVWMRGWWEDSCRPKHGRHACFECMARCSASISLWTSALGLFFFLTFVSSDKCGKHHCESGVGNRRSSGCVDQRVNDKMFSFDVPIFILIFYCCL